MSLGTSIKIALFGAALLPAAGAGAPTPTQVKALTAATIIYVSGSPATDPAIQAFFKLDPAVDANAPCKAGTYDLYKTSTGYVVTCTAGPVFGSFAQHKLRFV